MSTQCCLRSCYGPKLSDFEFTVEDPSVFVCTQWSHSRPLYLIYRAIFACFLVAGQVFFMYEQIPRFGIKMFIFLTQWTATVTTFYFLVAVSATLCNTISSTDFCGCGKLPKLVTPVLFKITWIAFNICLTCSMFVTLICWLTILIGTTIQLPQKIYTHGAGTFFVYLDLFVSATPVRVAHVVHGVIYGLIYIIFSGIYYAAGGTNPWGSTAIYSILDWNAPGPTMGYVVGGSVVAICLYKCCCSPTPPAEEDGTLDKERQPQQAESTNL